MARTIIIETFLEQRDVDAALYLLGRMLKSDDKLVGAHRARLEELKRKISRTRHITPADRTAVVASYREVIG